jgi:hypothetical protein
VSDRHRPAAGTPEPESDGTESDGTDLDALDQAYAASEVTVAVDGRTESLAGLADAFGGPVFALTAWNPMSRPTPAAVNRLANLALEAELEARGIRTWPAVGAAVDGSWSEDGFAVVGIGEDEALALGRAYGQRAIFGAADGRVVVLYCSGD